MRIPEFYGFIKSHLQSYKLENTTVVVDAQNIFYPLYQNSGLQFVLGSECDKYANYVRSYLRMFKENNIKCLFVLKGGHPNSHMLNVHFKRNVINGDNYVLGKYNDGQIIQPLLAKDVFIQVLEEMDFDFTICHTSDVIKECFDLANRLSCPVVSCNVQYCFSPAPYIPLSYGELTDCIYKRDNFLKKYNITLEKMILFIILTDIDIFGKSAFEIFFRTVYIPVDYIGRYQALLKWLSGKNVTDALNDIFKHIPAQSKVKFMEVKKELEVKYLTCDEKESAASLYFTNRRSLEFVAQDPLWFQKGIALKYISIPYINLYYWDIVTASRLIEDYSQENTIMLAMDIIKYGYDLLKNFNGKDIEVIYRLSSNPKKPVLKHFPSVSKPEYAAVDCIFENGWDNIDCRRIFQHFFLERLGNFDFDALEAAPEDSRLLILAMVYFTEYKNMDVEDHMYSIMLCYVLLSVVANKMATNENILTTVNSSRNDKPVLDSKTDKDSVTIEDCETANNILKQYHNVSNSEVKNIVCRKKVHPLLQFERCLQAINDLNRLCGLPYPPTLYRETYNATFVYKFLGDVDCEHAMQKIKDILSPAASVLAFTMRMIEIYKNIICKL